MRGLTGLVNEVTNESLLSLHCVGAHAKESVNAFVHVLLGLNGVEVHFRHTEILNAVASAVSQTDSIFIVQATDVNLSLFVFNTTVVLLVHGKFR